MSTINRVAHGLTAGQRVAFSSIVPGGTGLDPDVIYFIISAGLTADAFQVSETQEGTPLTLSGTVTSASMQVVPETTDTDPVSPAYTAVTDPADVMAPPVAPGAPSSLSMSSAVVIDNDGHALVRLEISLVQPVSATLRYSVVVVTPPSGPPIKVIIPAGQTTASIQGVQGNALFSAVATSFDTFGLESAASNTANHTTVGDSSAPSVPTGLAALGAIRGIFVSWNSVTATDLSHYELAVSADGGSTYPTVYKIKTIMASITQLATQTWFVKVRAVDLSGNASAYSSAVSAAARLVAGNAADIQANSITANDIAADTITANQIAANAITATELNAGAVTADKVAAGAITADKLTIGARTGQASLVPNHSFEDGVYGSVIAGWTIGTTNGGLGYQETVGAMDGAYSVALYAPNNTAHGDITSSLFGVTPGEVLFGSVNLYPTSTATGCVYFRLNWYKADGTASATGQTDLVAGGNVVSGVAQVLKGYATVPSDATMCRVQLYNYHPSAATYLCYDNVVIQRANAGVRNSDSSVIVDASGITIINGKLTFTDAYGTTALDGYGFGPSWSRFIATRLYNSDFAAGSTSDIAVTEVGSGSGLANYRASVTSLLPGWVVGNSGGTVALFADSSATDGAVLRFLQTGASQTALVYQDAPVNPGERYEAMINWKAVMTGAADFALNFYWSFRDSTHALIGSRIGGGLSYDTTTTIPPSSYASQLDGLGTIKAPGNAVYVRFEIEVAHGAYTAGTKFADVRFNSVAIRKQFYSQAAAASGALTLTTTPQNITGATVTVDPGTYMVFGTFDFDMTAAGNATLVGELTVDGVAQSGQALQRLGLTSAVTAGRTNPHQVWLITVFPGAAGVLRLRASKTAAVGTAVCGATHTTISVIPIGA